MGNRSAELTALLDSVQAQDGGDNGVRTVVLGQGVRLPELPEWVDAVGLKAWWSGFFEGVRVPCPPRRPMRWSTVWRMTRLGRPPVI